MRGAAWNRPAPTGLTVAVIAVVVAAGIGGVYLLRIEPSPGAPAPPAPPPADAVLPPDSYPAEPLPPGAPFPPFEAAGWVNGPPGGLTGRLTVVDVWTDWCPVCRQTPPGLMAAYREYHTRGVAFVSLTPVLRPAAERFVADFAVPWPCGYEVPAAAVGRLGAYNASRFSAAYHPRSPNYHPGHDTNPTMFLIGTDGRVLWNDGQARPRHTKDAAGVIADLNAAITRALGATPGAQ